MGFQKGIEQLQTLSEATRKFLMHFATKLPLTTRGALALILSTIAFLNYGVPESDLIIQVLCGSVMVLVMLSTLHALLATRVLKKSVVVDTYIDRANLVAQVEVASGMKVKHARLRPFTVLFIERVFDHQGVISKTHALKGLGRERDTHHIIDSLRFPHRGTWSLTELRMSVSDSLGFCKVTWHVAYPQSFDVLPRPSDIRPLPVLAASSQSGDQLAATRELTGDPYDIKQYAPGDSINRILWKVYARSRDLVVRRPEPAIVPEGEVALYLVASPEEDYVASAALSYVNQLIQSDITILFGTDGLTRSSASRLFVRSQTEILKEVCSSVWCSTAGKGSDFDAYLQSLTQAGKNVSKVVVFGPERAEWLNDVLRASQTRGIELVVTVVPSGFSEMFSEKKLIPKINKLSLGKSFRKNKQSSILSQASYPGAEVITCELSYR